MKPSTLPPRLLSGLVMAWGILLSSPQFAQASPSGAPAAQMFNQLDPQAIPSYLELGLKSLNECEIWIARINGERTVAFTWVTPPGMTGSYAAKSKVYVNLTQPWVRMIESWDEHGEMNERISFDKVVPATFTDADFDPKNSDYGF